MTNFGVSQLLDKIFCSPNELKVSHSVFSLTLAFITTCKRSKLYYDLHDILIFYLEATIYFSWRP